MEEEDKLEIDESQFEYTKLGIDLVNHYKDSNSLNGWLTMLSDEEFESLLEGEEIVDVSVSAVYVRKELGDTFTQEQLEIVEHRFSISYTMISLVRKGLVKVVTMSDNDDEWEFKITDDGKETLKNNKK